MANLCSFSMKLRGEPHDINAFIKVMRQEGDVWMGRGADAWLDEDLDMTQPDVTVTGGGSCKWSVVSALIDNAKEMRKQKETGKGLWYGIEKDDSRDFITLFEACERYGVNIELYSEEYGLEFEEHYMYNNGVILEDSVSATEVWLDDASSSKATVEEEYDVTLTDEQWDIIQQEGRVVLGGYNWEFSELSDPRERGINNQGIS